MTESEPLTESEPPTSDTDDTSALPSIPTGSYSLADPRSLAAPEVLAITALADLKRMQQIVDALPVLIAYVDAEERYRFNNRAYEKWLGVPRDQVTGYTLKEVMGDELYTAIAGNVAAVLAGETVAYERNLVTEGHEPLTQELVDAAKEQVLFPGGTLATPRKMASGEGFFFKPRKRSECPLMNGAPVRRVPKAYAADTAERRSLIKVAR